MLSSLLRKRNWKLQEIVRNLWHFLKTDSEIWSFSVFVLRNDLVNIKCCCFFFTFSLQSCNSIYVFKTISHFSFMSYGKTQFLWIIFWFNLDSISINKPVSALFWNEFVYPALLSIYHDEDTGLNTVESFIWLHSSELTA